MSDSVWPHRWQPTRLPFPWDSPGKNNGVGCHFLLQCMKVESEREVTQLCPTPSDPMDCSLPGSSIHGIFQARVLEWGTIAFSAVSTSPSIIHSLTFCWYQYSEVISHLVLLILLDLYLHFIVLCFQKEIVEMFAYTGGYN